MFTSTRNSQNPPELVDKNLALKDEPVESNPQSPVHESISALIRDLNAQEQAIDKQQLLFDCKMEEIANTLLRKEENILKGKEKQHMTLNLEETNSQKLLLTDNSISYANHSNVPPSQNEARTHNLNTGINDSTSFMSAYLMTGIEFQTLSDNNITDNHLNEETDPILIRKESEII